MKKITYSIQFTRLALLAVCFSISTISSLSFATSAKTSVYSEKVIIDFETVKLNWANGVGGYCFAGDVFTIPANPSIDAQNGSAFSLKWTRDASKGNPGGGYVMQFGTAQACTGWDRITFQIYSAQPFTSIDMTFRSGGSPNTTMGAKNVTCNVLANQWTTISMNMADINMVDKNFKEIMVQPGSASAVQIFDTYSDNFKFEAGTPVTTGITSAVSENTKIYAQTGKVIVDLSDVKDASTVTVFDIKGSVVRTIKSHGNEKLNISLENKGIYLVRVQNTSILTQKVIL